MNLDTSNLLAVGTEIAQLNYTVQNQDTFATIIARQTELDTSQDLEKVVAILRNIRGLFSGAQAGLILPSKTVAIANLPLFSNRNSSYQVQSGDSIQSIAMELVDKSNLLDTLKANSVVELDSLEYDVIPQQPPRSLTQLADNLNRETNRHRTVLETVQSIGNINDIITESALNNQLSVVAAAVNNISGLFGDEDIILANVLFNYTVTDEDSFETIIVKTGDSNSQILIDQTTAANIATENPNLELQSGKNIFLPDRFSLDINSENREQEQELTETGSEQDFDQSSNQLAIFQSSSQTTSLTEIANSMGTGITAAAVAIANQSLAGLLNSQGEGINITQVLAKLITLSSGDIDNLTAFVNNSTSEISSEDTFYTLKSRWETEILNDFHNPITLEASLVLQNIGTVNAIYEQLTFPDANFTSLHTSLTEALNQLKTNLLIDVNGNNLKPYLQPSTVHNTTVEIAPALNKIQTAIETLINSSTTASLLNIQTLLQDALYANKNESSSYSNQPLDGLHRIYELSCLKIAQELLTQRLEKPLTVAEIATAIANIPNLIIPNQNWIIPPPTASQTFSIPIRDENNHLNYPQELLFPVTVKVTMERNQNLMHPDSLPLNNLDSNNIGQVQIPIPLRDYPLPPSLIAHQAIPDPDSFAGDILSAEDIRDWNYVFLYEHPDVAQDTIECRIDYNSSSQTQLLKVDDVTVSENSGNAVFTVTLFPPSDQVVTVDYTTQDGTAIAREDYTTTTGSLRFAIGETSKTITVPILSDTILEDNEAFTLLLINATNAVIDDAEGIATIIDAPLLDTLVRFNQLYLTLTQELQPLATGITDDNRPAFHFALDAFATLAEEVANAWQNWQPIAIAQASRDTIDYNIDEDLSVDEQTKIVTIAPTKNLSVSNQQILAIDLPGYQLNTTKQDGEITTSPTLPYTNLEFNFTQLADTTGVETFGESSLPDRQITVANLDILEYQSAWGAIRLARNKNLIDGRETNPAFIFQTPEVRFKNRITPLIINDKSWDIAALGNSKNKTLAQHLETLFSVLLPTEITRPYDLRITCQYAFALVSNNQSVASDNQQLLAYLPVLMIPRFTVQKTNNITEMLTATQQLRENMKQEISLWRESKQPNTANGRYIFSISFFSHAANNSIEDNPNLPLLTVENLYLLLADIT